MVIRRYTYIGLELAHSLVWTMMVLLGVAFSTQAATVNLDGVLLKGSTRVGSSGSISDGVDLTSSTGNVDWVFFDVDYPNTVTAEVYAANEKICGDGLWFL